jgi:hypothetical protein
MQLEASRLVQDDAAASRGLTEDQDLIDESRDLDNFQRKDALPLDYGQSESEHVERPTFQFSTRLPSSRIDLHEQDTQQVHPLLV